jgi:hypothetical protein
MGMRSIDSSRLTPRENVSVSAADRSWSAAIAWLRELSAMWFAPATSCSETRVDTARDAKPSLRSSDIAARPLSALQVTVLPLISSCRLPMNVDVLFGVNWV